MNDANLSARAAATLWLGVLGLLAVTGASAQDTSFLPDPLQIPNGTVEMMGETIDMLSLQVNWQVTDVSIPGTGPEVAFRRSYGRDHSTPALVNWEVEVPRVVMETTPDGINNASCTGLFVQPFFHPFDYLIPPTDPNASPFPPAVLGQKYQAPKRLMIPGEHGRVFMKYATTATQFAAASALFTGGVKFVTNDNWVLGCSPTYKLIAVSPAGTKYTLDVVYRRIIGDLRWGTRGGTVVLAASRAEDVNGNYVTYTYTSQQEQSFQQMNFTPIPYDTVANLTRIEASDGRVIELEYSAGGHYLQKVKANGSEWAYAYEINGLKTVTMPEGQTWQYENNGPQMEMLRRYKGMSKAVTPSGATINYVYLPTKPSNYRRRLDTRTVSGPDLITKTVTYSTVWTAGDTTVTVSDGVHKDLYSFFPAYEFRLENIPSGTVYEFRAGQLKSRTTLDAASNLALRKESYEYEVPTLSIGGWGIGVFDYFDSYFFPHQGHYVVPKKRTIEMNGASSPTQLITDYSSFDAFGRAHFTGEAGVRPAGNQSPYLRNTTRTFFDNTALWVLGLEDTISIEGESGTTDNDYFPNGQLQKSCKFGICKTFEYYANGDLWKRKWVKDGVPKEDVLSNYFRGTPRHEVQQEGVVVDREINATGTLAWAKDALGNQTSYSYDGLGRVIGITPPIGNVTTVDRSDPRKIVLTRGNLQKTVSVDGLWRETQTSRRDMTQPSQQAIYTKKSYDSGGRLAFRSVASFNPNESLGIAYQYDAIDRPTRVTNTADGSFSTTCYTNGCANNSGVTMLNGELTIDERGYELIREYRSFGDPAERDLGKITQQVRKSTEAGGLKKVETRIDTDRWGNVGFVLQGGVGRTFEYNANKLLRLVTDPETGETEFTYDEVGNKRSSRTQTSPVTAFTYDDRNRLKTIDYPGATPDVTFNYFATDKVRDVTNSSARWDYTYNEVGKLKTEQLSVDAQVLSLIYGYDSNDSLSSIRYPGGSIVDYNPDALGRARKVGGYVTSLTYHPSGQTREIVFGNGQIQTNTLDARLYPDRTIASRPGELSTDIDYTFDVSGNLSSTADGAGGGNSRTLKYDGASRLTGADGVWGAGSFSYDDTGNLKSKVLGSRSWTFNYHPVNNRLDTVTGNANYTMTYDVYGNTTGNGVTTYGFNDASQLISVPSLGYVNYRYDGNGKRVRAQVSGQTVYSMYNQSGSLMFTTQGASTRATEFIHLGSHLIASRDYGSGVNSDTDNDGIPNYIETKNGLSTTVNDANGDSDGDGLSNAAEYQAGTSFASSDTDSDGMSDAYEVRFGLNALRNDAAIDADGDGLSNLQESQKRTDPHRVDSDGDGIPDATDPLPMFNPAIISIINELLL
ncbi:MAG: hypothetical protein ABI769_01880 [Pseudomonadota bacterium]